MDGAEGALLVPCTDDEHPQKLKNQCWLQHGSGSGEDFSPWDSSWHQAEEERWELAVESIRDLLQEHVFTFCFITMRPGCIHHWGAAQM